MDLNKLTPLKTHKKPKETISITKQVIHSSGKSKPNKLSTSIYASIWRFYNYKTHSCSLKSTLWRLIQENEYVVLAESSAPKAIRPLLTPLQLKNNKRINFRRRAVILDWLLCLSRSINTAFEVPYCAIYLIDNYLSKSAKAVYGIDELYSVAGVCLFVALKLYSRPLSINDLLIALNNNCDKRTILSLEAKLLKMLVDLPVQSYSSIEILWLMAAYVNLNERDFRNCQYLHESACYSKDLVNDQNLLVEGVFYIALQKIRLSKRKWDRISKFFGNSRADLENFVIALSSITQTLHWSDIKSVKLYYNIK